MRIIDANELIKQIYSQSDDDGWWVCMAKDLENLVNAQPTVNQWIPCSARLPEEDGMYLVSVNPYYVPPKDYTTDALYFHKGVWKYMDILKVHHAIVPELVLREFEWPIIAWMPLPEPYQEVKE